MRNAMLDTDSDPIDWDIRTRLPIHTNPAYPKQTAKKDDGKLEYTKQLFRELVKSPVYPKLRGLAYGLVATYIVPKNGGELISWMFAAVARSFLDMYFTKIETLGREIPIEEMPITDRVRPSFYADNLA